MAERVPHSDLQTELGAITPNDELRPVTSLFADVVGSTGLGERLMPSEVKAVIGECVSRMCEVVEGYGGHVRSYMGDGIAAFFGIEVTREDDSERAARAGLEILRTIAAYATEVRSAWGVDDLNVRVGINCGRVAVGQVGAAEPLTVALGDSVNVAARLQAAAQPGTVVVGGPVASAVSDRFIMRSVGKVPIRGREVDVDAFELVSEEPDRVLSFAAPFVGRASEVNLVSGMFSELLSGRGQVGLIIGEGGLGKTRLLAEARLRAPSDVLWLDGWCDPMDQRLPYEPFVQILRKWLGVGQRSSAIETRVRLKARGSDLLGERFDDCAPHLARLLGVDLDARLDRRLEGMPAEVLGSGLVKAYVVWLLALAERSAIVLSLDNFGSASVPAAELAHAILDALESSPICLLLTLRPEGRSPGWNVRVRALAEVAHRSTEIRLAPLAGEECHALIDCLDEQDLLDDRLRELIVDRAEGNPLYLEELFTAVSSDPSGDGTKVTQLPGALEALLLSRIDALPAQAKATLQAAAVLGRVFMKEVVETMTPTSNVNECLTTLLRADVIRERGRDPAGFIFRHGLVREAALSTLTPQRYRALNRSAADALTGWTAFDPERDAEALAGHYLACGDLEHAVECLEYVGDRMAMVGRVREAIGLYQRCLAELEPARDTQSFVRIARKLVEHLVMHGDVDQGMALLDEAIRHSEIGEGSELLLVKAEQCERTGRTDEASQALAEYLKQSGSNPRSLVLEGRLALVRQDLELANACVARIGDLSILSAEDAFAAASLSAGLFATTGDLFNAELLALQAQTLADQLGRVTDQLTARRHVALVCLLKGCARESYELTRFVYERYSELGFVSGRLETAVNLLHVGQLVGELEECARVADQVIDLAPSPMWTAFITSNWGVTEFERGNSSRALELASQTLEACGSIEVWPVITARMLNAAVALARKDWRRARDELVACEKIAERTGRDAERAVFKVLLAEALAQGGQLDKAVSIARAAYTTESRLDLVTRVLMQRAYGELIARVNKIEGDDILRDGLAQTRQMGLRLEEARTLVAIGSLEAERSEEYFDEAERIFTECGCQRGLVELSEAREVALIDLSH